MNVGFSFPSYFRPYLIRGEKHYQLILSQSIKDEAHLSLTKAKSQDDQNQKPATGVRTLVHHHRHRTLDQG